MHRKIILDERQPSEPSKSQNVCVLFAACGRTYFVVYYIQLMLHHKRSSDMHATQHFVSCLWRLSLVVTHGLFLRILHCRLRETHDSVHSVIQDLNTSHRFLTEDH